jgi:hypothetical protein
MFLCSASVPAVLPLLLSCTEQTAGAVGATEDRSAKSVSKLTPDKSFRRYVFTAKLTKGHEVFIMYLSSCLCVFVAKPPFLRQKQRFTYLHRVSALSRMNLLFAERFSS